MPRRSQSPQPGRIRRTYRRYRTELGWAAGIWVTQLVLGWSFGVINAYLYVFTGLVILWCLPASRDWVARRLGSSRRARVWGSALMAAYPGAPPVPARVETDPYGERVWVRVAPGSTMTALSKGAEALAAYLGVHEVRVARHPDNAGWVELRALRVDPLSQPTGPWPWAERLRPCSLWEPVPLGLDEHGSLVSVFLPEHNLLLGGEPGAGKSAALSLLVGAAAYAQDVSLWLMDGKLVELAVWRESAAGFAGADITEAIDVLRRLQGVMNERYRELLAEGRRKVARGELLHVLVCDELAHYLTWSERKARDAFTDLLRDLVSRGRAAGVIVVAATQKPGSDVVPTSLRDLFGYRLAMRCATAAASDTILGSGWATEGYSAAAISPATRGVGYLLHESGVPQRMRAFWADDDTVAAMARRAARWRASIYHGDLPGLDHPSQWRDRRDPQC